MTNVEQEKLLSMREILLTAIKREEEAYTFYISARQCARTTTEEEMFTRLAAQEMQHKRALEIQLEEIDSQLEIDRALSYDI
ncbi:MAG TPA: ferritin family protein [bacterium]|nr:ferritin family protein [bacterium]HOH08803.1 ferritin family protein [bacterium]